MSAYVGYMKLVENVRRINSIVKKKEYCPQNNPLNPLIVYVARRRLFHPLNEKGVERIWGSLKSRKACWGHTGYIMENNFYSSLNMLDHIHTHFTLSNTRFFLKFCYTWKKEDWVTIEFLVPLHVTSGAPLYTFITFYALTWLTSLKEVSLGLEISYIERDFSYYYSENWKKEKPTFRCISAIKNETAKRCLALVSLFYPLTWKGAIMNQRNNGARRKLVLLLFLL